MEETNEISLQEIAIILWQKVLIIILATVIGGVVAFCVSRFVINPLYTSRISMYVNNNQNPETTVANINDINASQKLVATYIEILRSDAVLTEVLEETGASYTIEELRKMMTANSLNGTEIFEVKVQSKDPVEAAHIANTIATIAPGQIIRVVKAGSVELIDAAVVATMPSSPNVMLNTLIGLMLGAVLSILGVLVAAMMDNRIKSEDDLKKNYDLPILGAIPDLEDANTRIK